MIWWGERLRPKLFGRYREGVLIQASLLVSMVVQNLIVPRALGAENYGTLVSLTIWPNLMMGLAEPLVTAFMARARVYGDPSALRRLSFVFRVMAIFATIVTVASIFAARRAISHHADLTAQDISLLAALSPLSLASVLFLAIRITGKSRTRVAAAYLLQSFATLACFELPFAYGIRGALLLFVANQVAALLVLVGGADWWKALQDARIVLSRGRMAYVVSHHIEILSHMLAAISPRLMTILLSIISVLIASMTMKPADLGMFRVGVTIVNAAQYAVPINNFVLLAMFEASTEPRQRRRMAVHAISSAALVGLGVAALAFLCANQIFGLILRHSEGIGSGPYLLFTSIPLFVTIAPVSSVLIGARHERVVVRSFALALGAFIITAVLFSIEAAFVSSCSCFLIPSAYALKRFGYFSDSPRDEDIQIVG